MFFSPSAVAFFNQQHTGDCIEISDELFNTLHDHLLSGGTIAAAADGQPLMVPKAAPPEPDYYAAAYAKVDRWRAEQEQGTVVYNHALFDGDRAARDRITNVLLLGVNPLGIWTGADNVDHPMDIDGLRGLHREIVAQGARVHARQRQLKSSLGAMTAEQLKAFAPGW